MALSDELNAMIRERILCSHVGKWVLRSLYGRDNGFDEDLRHLQRPIDLQTLAVGLVSELYTQQCAIDAIGRIYFDKFDGLFPKSQEELHQLVAHAENLVNLYNDHLASGLESRQKAHTPTGHQDLEALKAVDLVNLAEENKVTSRARVEYLVDMAEAEAMEAMGETEKASPFVDRHL